MLTAVGAVVCVLALAALALGVTFFLRAVPLDVLEADGSPGPRTLASAPEPGSVDLTVVAGTTYTVWTVRDAGATSLGGVVGVDDITVVDGSGEEVTVRYPTVSGNASRGGRTAVATADLVATEDGTVTITLDDRASGNGFLVTEGWEFGAFFATVGGTVLLWFAGIGGGIVGAGLLIGGIIWWVVARGDAQPRPVPR
ncbi:hypothetical protein [Oerskovia flava]|uniref:hypothetical protein n=1 Tax=Oerskovia flava TaxID=2986422 RepID=UPI002240A631|nr:hypothetical protein [Oerskovia sp. JB1-3-2]